MYSPGCATDISAIAQELPDDYKVTIIIMLCIHYTYNYYYYDIHDEVFHLHRYHSRKRLKKFLSFIFAQPHIIHLLKLLMV